MRGCVDTMQGWCRIEVIRWQAHDGPIDCALDKEDGYPRFPSAGDVGSLHIGVSNTLGSQRPSPSEKVPTKRSECYDGLTKRII